jgi:hypothetical protein
LILGLLLHFAHPNITIVGTQTPLSLFFDQGHPQQVQKSGARVEVFNGFGGYSDQNTPNP